MPRSDNHPSPSNDRVPASRFRNLDGVTSDERDEPPSNDPAASEQERAAIRQTPAQMDLFAVLDAGEWAGHQEALPPLTAHSSFDLARTEYRRHLEGANRPANTIEAYSYDLAILAGMIGPRPINRIGRGDIARFLADTSSKSTRKRRLTSARRFFRYLIDDARVLRADPTEGYYPHQIALRTPVPLFPGEQAALLAAAEHDEPWSALAIQFMMHLGLTRAELLALQRDHLDRTTASSPVIYVVYDQLSKQSKDRRLAGTERLGADLERYLQQHDIHGVLFSIGPPAVNGMVDRVRRLAGLDREVTPQTLRTTFAVEQARAGADQETLLALLGLVNDPRNRASVNRYIALAQEPQNALPEVRDASTSESHHSERAKE